MTADTLIVKKICKCCLPTIIRDRAAGVRPKRELETLRICGLCQLY